MPIFGFTCRDCGASFEEWVPTSAAIEKVSCPECNSREIQKQLSRVARLSPSGSPSGSLDSASSGCSTGGT